MTAPNATHTRIEILSQPQCWKECFGLLDSEGTLEKIGAAVRKDAEGLFIGCGSSYYVAQAAAASWEIITGTRARAVPASELLLYPDSVLRGTTPCQPVLISRSGYTSEIVQAAEYLEKTRRIPTLGVSCDPGHPLGQTCSANLFLSVADEQSVVTTRFFSSALMCLQALAARLARHDAVAKGLRRLADGVGEGLDGLDHEVQQFVEARPFADYVFLGQGPLYPVACEGQLKITEMSRSYAQAYHTLEFRHGPKAVAGPETLITFLMSESATPAEREVLEEVKSLGAATLVIANQADARTQECADFLVELQLEAPESARLAAYVITCQLLGLYTGIKKGCKVDNPQHLSRAVVVNRIGG